MSTRYRRIIDAYREALRAADPLECRMVDAKMESQGEGWVCDDYTEPDLDRMMTAGEIAEEFGFSRQNIIDWARRHPEDIVKHKDGNRVIFSLREVLKYHAGRL